MTSQDAMRLLVMENYPLGTFLVRYREGSPGDYTLSLRNNLNNLVSNYPIKKDQLTGEL